MMFQNFRIQEYIISGGGGQNKKRKIGQKKEGQNKVAGNQDNL